MKLKQSHDDVPNLEQKLEYISDLLRSLRELASGPELRDLRTILEAASLMARVVRLQLQTSDDHLKADLLPRSGMEKLP